LCTTSDSLDAKIKPLYGREDCEKSFLEGNMDYVQHLLVFFRWIWHMRYVSIRQGRFKGVLIQDKWVITYISGRLRLYNEKNRNNLQINDVEIIVFERTVLIFGLTMTKYYVLRDDVACPIKRISNETY
jgi:hypothetical protein